MGVRKVMDSTDGRSVLYEPIPDWDPHFPVRNRSKVVQLFGSIALQPGETRQMPLSWAISLADNSDFEVLIGRPPVPIMPGQVLQIRRFPGLGDVIFALAAIWQLTKEVADLEIWIQVRPEFQEWVGYVPFVNVGKATGAQNFVNLDAINHCAPQDRTLEMADSLGVKNRPEYHFPIKMPEQRPPSFEDGRPYAVLAPWGRYRQPLRSMPDTLIMSLIEEYRSFTRLPLVVVDAFPVELPHEDGYHLINITGRTTVTELMMWIQSAAFIISIDTGVLYAGALFRRPVVGVYTHISPAHRMTLVESPYQVVTPDIDCFPCGDRVPHKCAEALGIRDGQCVTSLRAEDIMAAVDALASDVPSVRDALGA